jgi:hypothetical protein
MWPKTHKVRRPIPFFASTKIAKCVLYAAATYVANALASIGCERATEPITAKRAEGYPLEFSNSKSADPNKHASVSLKWTSSTSVAGQAHLDSTPEFYLSVEPRLFAAMARSWALAIIGGFTLGDVLVAGTQLVPILSPCCVFQREQYGDDSDDDADRNLLRPEVRR